GSGYFDGTTDYLTGNGQLSSSASMSTFTVEGWLYPTTLGNNFVIGDMDATGATNVLSIRTGNSGDLVLYWYDGATKECYSPNGSLRVNQWNYFAIVVNSNAISMYINSTTAASLTGTTTLTNRTQTSNFAVGQINNAQNYPGYIGSLRWSNGIARTISAIPTAPYTSDANTRLLLNFTNAGIVDGTMKNNLETVGNAQVSTAVVKYGSGSMFFDGTGDYLYLPSNRNLELGTGDFTLECWVYATSAPSDVGIFESRTDGNGATTNGFTITAFSSSVIRIFSGSVLISSSGTSYVNTWCHVAVTRVSGTFNLYINGVSQGTSTTARTLSNTDAVVGGGRYGTTGAVTTSFPG
ncbi:MAG: LamG-like jellyroll fold domain-containing protein, partial [Bacteroidota bacterium]